MSQIVSTTEVCCNRAKPFKIYLTSEGRESSPEMGSKEGEE